MTERDARERAAIRILINGLPNSPGGVGPVIRLMEKRRLIKQRWEQRRARRVKAEEKADDSSAASKN